MLSCVVQGVEGLRSVEGMEGMEGADAAIGWERERRCSSCVK